ITAAILQNPNIDKLEKPSINDKGLVKNTLILKITIVSITYAHKCIQKPALRGSVFIVLLVSSFSKISSSDITSIWTPPFNYYISIVHVDFQHVLVKLLIQPIDFLHF